MKKLILYTGSALAMLAGASPALAQEVVQEVVDSAVFPARGLIGAGVGIGLGLMVMGGARGIGNIGSSAVESMARQPEAAKDIAGGMLLTAAFVEGATLFAIVVGLLVIVMLPA